MNAADAQDKGAQAKKKAITVETAAVSYHPMNTIVEAVGTSKANRSVDIMAISSGVVREIVFKDAQLVQEGAVLVRLDDDIQRADLAEAEARLTEAEQSLKRSQSLRKRDAVAVSSVEKLLSEVAIAKANRDRAVRRLQDRTLKAPFSGRIGFSDIEVGSHLKADETVAVLDDLSRLKVEFYLQENLFGKITIGTPVVINIAAFEGKTFKGTVEAIDTRINETSRSFKVRADIANEEGLLPAGMFLHLSLILDATQALSVPEESVLVDGTQSSVFVVDGNGKEAKVRQRKIKIGRRAFGWIEVLDGLAETDVVVVRGIQKIRDGSTVNAVQFQKTSVTQ